MVEFGAGGNIVQNEEPVGEGGDATAAAEGTSGTAQADGTTPADATNSAPGETTAAPAAAPAAADPPATTATRRRKRKAKGWFCPVCRQRSFSSSFYRIICSHDTLYSIHLTFANHY